jgi:transposase
MVRVIEDLAADWRRLDERIEDLSREITTLARQDAGCERVMSIPGIGPIISSAMVAAIGTGDSFSKGCDFAAWLGLVPKQTSTGDRTILGKISYIRVNQAILSFFPHVRFPPPSRHISGRGPLALLALVSCAKSRRPASDNC